MAEHMIETRILLRYDTYSNWMNSNTILKQGEAAIAAFPQSRIIDSLSNSTPEHTPPAIGIKIGDGIHYFRELPWVQGVAADVYNWAKTSTKPSYTAAEITGLQSFIEENFHISGDVTFTPRIYQIVQGTGEDSNKYYLQYKESNEQSQWIIDTNHPIDLSTYKALVDWVGNLVELFPNIGTFTATQTGRLLENLTYTDTFQANQFVTSVSETNGIISVEKARPTFSNLAGAASVAQGGTGRTSLTTDNVLVGNGENSVKLIPIAESIANNNHLVPNNLIKAYVDNAVRGLSGAMHFIGDATVVINNNSVVDPRIQGYIFANAQPGDVILYDAKEFVWTGSFWRLLGDEGSYAVKGSIVDADIDEEANINISKIANLTSLLNQKVDKVSGKQLSTNDFSQEYKEKLDNIEENAQRNKIEHIFLNGNEIQPTTVEQLPSSINLLITEFDENSQQKLSSIETGAQANIIERVIYDGETIVPDENKTITITPNPHTEHENTIESIFINNVEYPPNINKQVKITIDEAALNLQVIKGARVPKGGLYEDVDITQDKKLELSRIAKTGNIDDIIQTPYTYVILDCGSSTELL